MRLAEIVDRAPDLLRSLGAYPLDQELERSAPKKSGSGHNYIRSFNTTKWPRFGRTIKMKNFSFELATSIALSFHDSIRIFEYRRKDLYVCRMLSIEKKTHAVLIVVVIVVVINYYFFLFFFSFVIVTTKNFYCYVWLYRTKYVDRGKKL